MVINERICPGWKSNNLESFRVWNKYSISPGFVDKSCWGFILWDAPSLRASLPWFTPVQPGAPLPGSGEGCFNYITCSVKIFEVTYFGEADC